jgi:gamma-glutamylcysteine synthetase
LPPFKQYHQLILISVFKCQVGLLYDEDSLQSVLDMTADWTSEERQMLRNKVTQNTFTMELYISIPQIIICLTQDLQK